MSLIVPPFQFAHCTDSIDGVTPTTGAIGTAVTAGANNADTTTVTLLTALAHDVHRLVIGLGGFAASGVDVEALASIVVDPAGGTSWVSLIDYLTCGMLLVPNSNNAVPLGCVFVFPQYVAAGSSLGIRARTNHTSDVTGGRAVIWAFGNPNRPDAHWHGQKVETLGVTAASSKGTDITPGASGTWGSWVNVGSPTTARAGSVQLGINGVGTATATARAFHWQIGYGGSRLSGSPTMMSGVSSAEAGTRNGMMPIPCDIPAGTQLQVRSTSSGALVDTPNVALYVTY